MVYLNDVAVDCHFPQIAFHVPGGDELHFLLNQRSFFLCYSEFDLYRSFASVHAFAPFHSEGLGYFPTSHFQPTRRSVGGRKYGSGYPLPMLATKVFPYSLLQRKAPFCQIYAKEKRCNLQRLQRFLKSIFNFAGHSHSSSFSTSAISFAVAVTIRSPVSLMPSSSASSCRRCVFFSAGLSERNWSTDIL